MFLLQCFFLGFFVLLSLFIFSFCVQIFVEENNVDFGVDEVGAMSDGTIGVVSDRGVGCV